MPKQVLPDAMAFDAFFKKIQEKYSCKKVPYEEIRHWVSAIDNSNKRNQLPQHKKSGTELAFVYDRPNHPIRVVIWTTYVAGSQSARKQDAAWVLLVDKRSPDKPIFYSFPVHRTKNFFERFEKYIAAFISLVDTWPDPCIHCNQEPTIRTIPGNELLQYAFVCSEHHRLPRTWLYQNLPDEHRLFLEKAYRDYASYRSRNAEQGIVRTPRVFIRAGVGKPNKQRVDHDGASQVNPKTDEFPFNDLQYEGLEE
jgi:hypothetical protein